MKNPSIRYGFLGGAAVIFYFVILYFVNKELFLNPWLQWASMAVYLFFMWQAAKEDCVEKGMSRDFREILRTPFVVFLLINLLYWLFFYTLHLADPVLLQMETAAQIQYFKNQLTAGAGDPQEANQLREHIQYLEKEGMSLAMGDIFLRMGVGAIGGFVLSGGIAAFFHYRQ